jgi:hypothetical protein
MCFVCLPVDIGEPAAAVPPWQPPQLEGIEPFHDGTVLGGPPFASLWQYNP